MFSTECAYQRTAYGILFLPPDCESECFATLDVEFEPLVYTPGQASVGAGADYDYTIVSVFMTDEDGYRRELKGRDLGNAEGFLERYCPSAMHEQACAETAEAFGAIFWRAA